MRKKQIAQKSGNVRRKNRTGKDKFIKKMERKYLKKWEDGTSKP